MISVGAKSLALPEGMLTVGLIGSVAPCVLLSRHAFASVLVAAHAVGVRGLGFSGSPSDFEKRPPGWSDGGPGTAEL